MNNNKSYFMLIQVRYTDPRSKFSVHSSKRRIHLDQGSVVVLRRRTTHSSFVAMSHVHCNLNYSGLNPTATTH